MTRPLRARIDLQALAHNFSVARNAAPNSRIMAVIKANAYGHGAVPVSRALAGADAYAVASVEEAMQLREAGIRQDIVLLEGVFEPAELELAVTHQLQLVIHTPEQVRWLETFRSDASLRLWLKLNTGMNRLGFSPREALPVWQRLQRLSYVKSAGLRWMSHLACADELDSPVTDRQLGEFAAVTADRGLPRSIANSAGILHWPASHADWNRPGIMLYGCDPSGALDGGAVGLEAVMRVTSEIIAIRDVRPGEGVGYGQRWLAAAPARIGTVSVGYGDGYPRHAPDGTPVWVKGRRVPLAGTVSMDMITVDLTGHDDIRVGDEVELWGPNLAVNEVAARAGTIGYELLAGMTARLPRIYRDEDPDPEARS